MNKFKKSFPHKKLVYIYIYITKKTLGQNRKEPVKIFTSNDADQQIGVFFG